MNQKCSKMLFRWRWIFPSQCLSESLRSETAAAWKLPAALLNLVFPDECRVCASPLKEFSAVPVCAHCLAAPKPLLAEYFCADCGTPFMNAAPLDDDGRCGLCRRGLNGFDRVYSFGEYDGTLRRLIHLFKYSGFKPLAAPFGRLLLTVLPREQRFDMVVPMPLHWRRAWDRGFNQAELLARLVSKRIGAPMVNALRRTHATRIQAGLTNSQRRENVAGVFAARTGKPVLGMHVLLIDDVLTTGATVSAAALELKRAGATRVTILTLARVDRRRTSFAREELVSA